ncbi:MAG: T9SS type A sorting domain-containing protein [Flavipsychrobacter sp.]
MKRLFTLLISIGISTIAFAQYNQQHPKLTATGLPASASFGGSVSLSDDASIAIVGAWGGTNGATGQAVIMNRNGSIWTQGQTLVGSGAIGGANQGNSVAVSGDGNTAIIGGPNDNNGAGAAWIFVKNGTTWTEQTKLVGTGATGNAWQGFSVAISADGNTVIVGGPQNNTHVGAAWVFTRSGTTWTQQAMLQGSDAVSSSSYPSEQGYCVAMSSDGSTALVGGRFDGGAKGAAWFYARNGNSWTQQGGKATGSTLQPIGTSVALSANGNVAVIGAAAADSKTGGAFVVTRTGSTWTPYSSILQGTLPVGKAQQGGSVDISNDGKTVVMGGAASIFTPNSGDIGIGSTWIFKYDGSNWNQEGNKYVGTGNSGNSQQGGSVSISADGNTFVTGGFGDNNFNGAVWVFSKTIPPTTSVNRLSRMSARVYPNPVNNTMHIDSDQPIYTELIALDGKVVIKKTTNKSLDVSNLPANMYFLNCYNLEGQLLHTEKIIKSK